MRSALCLALAWAALFNAAPLAARERFQCSIERQAAEAILDLRDRGQTRAFVTAPLPSRESVFNGRQGSLQARLAVQMHGIIDDVYSHPGVQAGPYLAYRMAACSERNAGRKVPRSFAEVALPMSGCQQKHGLPLSTELSQCAREVIEYYQSHEHREPTD